MAKNSHVKRLIKKFSDPDFKSPPVSFDEELQSDHVNAFTDYDTTKLLQISTGTRLGLENDDLSTIEEALSHASLNDDTQEDAVDFKESDMINTATKFDPVTQESVIVDSRTGVPVDQEIVNSMLPFKEKDFKCRFTSVRRQHPNTVFVARESDYFYYTELQQALESICTICEYHKFREFPRVVYDYCDVLMKSGFDPRSDLLVNYLIKFVKRFKSRPFSGLPLKIKLIARIFSIRNLKKENIYSNSEIVEDQQYLKSDISTVSFLEIDNSWLTQSDDYILNQLHQVNLNLLLSRAIRYATFCYWQHRQIRKRVWFTWTAKYEKHRRLSFNYHQWEELVMRKSISKWANQLEKHKNLATVSSEAYNRTLRKCYFRLWRDSLTKVRSLDNNVFQRKYWQNMVSKYEHIQRMKMKANDFDSHSLKYRCLKAIILQSKVQHHQGQILRNSAMSSSRVVLNILKKKMEVVRSMTSEADIFNTTVTCGPYFLDWRWKYERRNKDFKDRVEALDKLVLKRYFNSWRLVTCLSLKVYIFKQTQEKLMKQFLFSNFQKAHQLNTLLLDYNYKKNESIVHSYLSNWHKAMQDTVKAKQFDYERLKVKALHLLTRGYENAIVDKYYNHKLKKRCFQHWARQKEINKRVKALHSSTKSRFFKIWRDSLQVVTELESRGLEVYEYFNSFTRLKNWYELTLFWQEQSEYADLVFLKKFLKKTVTNYHKKSADDEAAITKLYKLHNKRLLKTYFNKIKDFSESRKEERLENMLNQYIDEQKSSQLLKRHFIKWVYETDKVLYLDQESHIFFQRRFFNKVVVAFNRLAHYEAKADEVYNANLSKKMFQKLIDGSNKAYDLRQALESFVNSHNYQTLEKVWHIWNVKLVKLQQMSQSQAYFVNKWNKFRSRSLLLIWKEKTYEKTAYGDYSSFSFGNRSARKISPIKSFNQKLNSQYVSYIDEDVPAGSKSAILIENNELDFDEDLGDSPSLDRQKRILKQTPEKEKPSDVNSVRSEREPLFRDPIASSTPFARPNLSRFQPETSLREISPLRRQEYIRNPDPRLRSKLRRDHPRTPSNSKANATFSLANTTVNSVRSQRLQNLKLYYSKSG